MTRAIDLDTDLIDPLYDLLGIEAVLLAKDGRRVELTVIDKSAGIELVQGNLLVQGQRPAACVRMSELEAAGLARDSVRDGRLTFSGRNWTIEATQPKPAPGARGELYLFLVERGDG